ncbi:MAG: hypothetical protein AAGA85_12995 [Bacteroidota bacterium]
MIKFVNFFKDFGEEMAMIAILLVVLYFCLRDFNAFSKKSWVLLIGVSALGGFVIFRGWKKKKLRKELLEREGKLKEMEERYKGLLDEKKIAKSNYDTALKELEEAKKNSALKVLAAEREYETRVAEIRKRYQDMSSQDVINEVDNILSGN